MRVIKFFSSAHFAPFLWSFPSGLLFVALKNPSPVHYNEKKNYYNYYTEIKIFHFFQTLMQISFSKLVENASDQTEGRERQFSGVCPKTENLTIKPCKMFGRVINDKFGYLKKSRQKPSICSSLKITTDLYPSYECFYLFPRLESCGCVKFPWSALQTMFTQWVEFLEKS